MNRRSFATLLIAGLWCVSAAWSADPPSLQIVARDPDGHGLLCHLQNKTVLLVQGTPQQMGTAHGRLLREPARRLVETVVYTVGAVDSVRSGRWFFDQMAEIERRTTPHISPRFFEECAALAGAAGISVRDARYANLFPERFHCSGVAVRGKASKDGRVLHARVLDYMRDINLQDHAAVVVFMPDRGHRWMTLGYAGFLGSVTAMNERGLAIGEMGGGGVGNWDGTPMSLLIRQIMEQASTVDEAVAMFRAAHRTCEYYYVVSDKSRAMAALRCTKDEVTVLRPGEQHPELPKVPEDTVFISGGDRAKRLSERLEKAYGQIDVPAMIELIKRPVAMSSNLHDAVFSPETLEMWFADAGKRTPACDEPYVRCKLDELIAFYEQHITASRESAARVPPREAVPSAARIGTR